MSEKIKDVTEMEVFRLGHELTLEIYKITSTFPKEEVFGIISQMRRSAYSICSNLMEGAYRNSTKEFKQFCGISRGSLGELKYFLLLSKDVGYISEELYKTLFQKIESISKMLFKLIKRLEESL